MKNSSILSGRALLAYLLFVLLSALAILSLAQGNQDQDQPTAMINLNANYNAEAKTWDKDGNCEDQITITYGGSARYQLLPAGYGTSNVHPEILTTHAALGVDAERTGGFTLNVQGGGNCVSTGKNINPGKLVWTYKAQPSQVAPKDWPAVAVRLRAGDYGVDEGADPYRAFTCEGQMIVAGAPPIPNIGCPGPAEVILLMLQQQSIQKVSDALSGKIEPFSKQFSRSNSVSDSVSVNESNRTGSASMNISYSLTVGAPEQVEAIIIPPADYDQWIPQGGPDEDTPGNTIAFQVKLQKKGQPNSKPAQKAQFKFELEEVSHEPGVCMNWPPKSQVKDPADFDLKIVKPNLQNSQNLQNILLESVDKNGQSATSRPKLSEADLTVTSYDYGAYGKLKVSVQLQDGSPPFDAHLEGKPDVTEVTIPLVTKGNRIADAWEKSYSLSNTREIADDDSEPEGDGTPGDGLSLYEEYRGFHVQDDPDADQNGHIRTDPTKKDVFIRNRGQLPVTWFTESNMVLHLIGPNEYWIGDSSAQNPAVINFNTSGFGHNGYQHVLRLINKNLTSRGNGLLGQTGCMGCSPGPPGSIQGGWVRVDAAACLAASKKWGGEELLSTVAHELAHGCNVFHHGGRSYQASCVRTNGEAAPGYDKQVYGVSYQGDENSGDHDCIMRYEGTDLSQAPPNDPSAHPLSWLKARTMQIGKKTVILCPTPASLRVPWIEGTFYPPDPGVDLSDKEDQLKEEPGTTFCTTQAGMPYPKAGNADPRVGKCQQQFCINDNQGCKFNPQ